MRKWEVTAALQLHKQVLQRNKIRVQLDSGTQKKDAQYWFMHMLLRTHYTTSLPWAAWLYPASTRIV